MQTGRRDLDGLLEHPQRTTTIGPGEVQRVVEGVLTWFEEDTEAFVRRRHRELRAEGVGESPRRSSGIAAKLTTRRVTAPRLSVRQIPRVI